MKFNMRLFQRKNGIWYAEIQRGRWRSLKTKDKRYAQRLFKALEKEVLKGRLVSLDKSTRITFIDFTQKFFEFHTDIGADARRAYDLAARKFADSIGGSTLLSRIGDKHLAKFVSDCLAQGLKRTSINTYLRHLRTIFNKALKWGDLREKIYVEMIKTPKRLPRFLTEEERVAILKYSKKHEPEIYRVILFGLWTGCRRSEIVRLRWQDVSKDSCRIIGKGDKERIITLLSGAWEAMGVQKEIGFVFHQWKRLGTYSKKFKAIARACGILDIHLHNLRHTAATVMLSSGVPIEVVQGILGHADISTTQIYAAVLLDYQKKELQKFNY